MLLRLCLAAQLLLLAHAQAPFVPSANCPAPIYITESLLSPWVGISVDTADTQVTIANGLNFLKCSPKSLFVYIQAGITLTRADWWLACSDKATNGWRVRDAYTKNTNYGTIPVGCVKPTHTVLPLFDGTESILTSYPTYQLVDTQPPQPLLATNGSFTYVCLAGSTIGFAASATTITHDASTKITCAAEGWWVRTKADLTGRLLPSSTKIGCFKPIAAPATCVSTGAPEKSTTGTDSSGRATVKCAVGDPWIGDYDIEGFTCMNGLWFGTSNNQPTTSFGASLPSSVCENRTDVRGIKKITVAPSGSTVVTIYGSWVTTRERFEVNFQTDAGTIAAHMSVRPFIMQIGFNTLQNGTWGTEEPKPLVFGVGAALKITVTIDATTIKWEINGAVIHTYTSRIGNSLIRRVQIAGEDGVVVDRIEVAYGQACDSTGAPEYSTTGTDSAGRATVTCNIGDPWIGNAAIEGFTCVNGNWFGTSGNQPTTSFGATLPSFTCDNPTEVRAVRKVTVAPSGTTIVTIDAIWSKVERFDVYCVSELGNIAAAMSVRTPPENQIVFNSYLQINKDWGTEERTGLGFGTGSVKIIITFDETTVKWEVNGAVVKTYTSRIANSEISRIQVRGLATLTVDKIVLTPPSQKCNGAGAPADSTTGTDSEGRATVKCNIGDPWIDNADIEGFTCVNGIWFGTSGNQPTTSFGATLPSFTCDNSTEVRAVRKVTVAPSGTTVVKIYANWATTSTRFDVYCLINPTTVASMWTVRPAPTNLMIFNSYINDWGQDQRTALSFGYGAVTITITFSENTIKWEFNGKLALTQTSRAANSLIKRIQVLGSTTVTVDKFEAPYTPPAVPPPTTTTTTTTVAPTTTTTTAPTQGQDCTIPEYNVDVCTAFYNSKGVQGCTRPTFTTNTISCPPSKMAARPIIVNKVTAKSTDNPYPYVSVACDTQTKQFMFTDGDSAKTVSSQAQLEAKFGGPIGVSCSQ